MLLSRLGLQQRIVLLVTGGLIMIFAVLALVTIQGVDDTREAALQDRLASAELAAQYVDQSLRLARSRLETAASSPFINLDDGTWEPELWLLPRIQDGLGIPTMAVFVLDDSGTLLVSSSRLSKSELSQLVESFVRNEMPIDEDRRVSKLVLDGDPPIPTVFLAVPVRGQGDDVRGVLATAIDVSSPHFVGFVRTFRPGKTGYMQVVDAEGMVVAHTIPERASEKSNHLEHIGPLLWAGKPDVGAYDVIEDGRVIGKEVIAFSPLSEAPWGVFIEQVEDEALAPINQLGIRLGAIAGGSLVLALVLALLTTSSVIKPIRMLTRASRRLALGDLAARVPVLGGDEIAELAKSFNTMQEKLLASRKEIENWNKDLEERVQERTARLYQVAMDLNKAQQDLQATYLSTLEALAHAIDARDAYTHSHSQQVAQYAVEIGREIGFSDEQLECLRRAALLHDLGKIGIPDAVLRKPGVLDEREWQVIRYHPELSFEMLSQLQFLADSLAAIRYHHERYDGKGYPDGLAGEQIPLGARILAVADAFHAMTSERPYQDARSFDDAKKELLRGRGTQFDPGIVDAFLNALRRAGVIGETRTPVTTMSR